MHARQRKCEGKILPGQTVNGAPSRPRLEVAEPIDEYLPIVVVALSLVLRMTAMLMRIGGHTLFMFPPPLNNFLKQRALHWRNKSVPAEAITETRDSPRHSVYGICPRCITSCVSLRTLPSDAEEPSHRRSEPAVCERLDEHRREDRKLVKDN